MTHLVMKLKKIISGGQTGVDQSALQVAIDAGLEHGGWCPPGRVCESGIIPDHFHLKETAFARDTSAPNIPRSQRTIWNIRDSDGTLIFWDKEVAKLQSDKGTKLTLDIAKKLGKPYLVVDLNSYDVDQQNVSGIVEEIKGWLIKNEIEILSVGGPSENTCPGIFKKTYHLLLPIVERLK